MIATLRGQILFRHSDRAVIEVQGVGYEVFLTTDTVARLPDNEEQLLHIYTHVREDAFILFGFLQEEDKEMFVTLIQVSGIGPKLGLAILSGCQVGDLCQAISTKDFKFLTAIKGVGKKTAERICLDLKDKVGHLATPGAVTFTSGKTASAAGTAVSDALSALVNLGYPDPVARQALVAVKKEVGEKEFAGLDVQELLRLGLRGLA